MVNILFIIPYKSLGDYVENYIAKCNVPGIKFRVEDIYGTDVSEVEKIKADIVVARGLSGSVFRQVRPEVHHIEIPVTSYDMLYAIVNLRKRSRVKTVAVVWTKGIHLELLEEVLGLHINQYIIHDGIDMEGLLDRIEMDGNEAVIGGLTIGRYCKQRGIEFTTLVTTEETLEHSLNEAVNMAQGINVEKRKNNLMRVLLDQSKEAVCVVNVNGGLLDINQQFCRKFDIPEDWKERLIDEIIEEKNWWREKRPMTKKEVVQNVKDHLEVVSCIPIKTDEWDDMFMIVFQDAEQIQNMENKIRNQLREKGLVAKYRFENIIGRSEKMAEVLASAQKYSQFDANILLTGESGTGKELFAQSIHNASQRNNKPFVAINCAAIPEQLLESEMFGYAEGSFTGATKGGKIGLFEQAHKGTLFLDEIGEMPLALQAKLLRVLQEKEVRRLGDNKVIPIDVRVICATNVKIEEMVQEGKFRMDLFYRINLFNLRIPPLRERPEDVPELFTYFVNKYARKNGIREKISISEESFAIMKRYSWPGNVRELQNFSERIVALYNGECVDEELVKKAGLDEYAFRLSTKEKVEPVEEKHEVADEELFQKLKKRRETKEEMAKRLGISRSTLYRRMKELKEEK